MTQADTQKRSGGRWLLLVLLLALLGGGAYYAYKFYIENWAFSYRFDGCDEAGACGKFELYAPGNHFAWTKNEATIVSDPGADEFAAELGSRLRGSKGVIAVGLASSEGASDYNRRLSACRSRTLARKLYDTQSFAKSRTDIYRVALGRYTDDETEFSETQVQRNAVFVFIESADNGIVLEEAIRAGLGAELRAELDAYGKRFDLGDPGKLDFRNYDCWASDLKITGGVARRTGAGVCYDESVAGFNC